MKTYYVGAIAFRGATAAGVKPMSVKLVIEHFYGAGFSLVHQILQRNFNT
jgi:hypothetical protein